MINLENSSDLQRIYFALMKSQELYTLDWNRIRSKEFLCPLAKLCGGKITDHDLDSFVKLLDLSSLERYTLIEAADNPQCIRQDVRKNLLNACGIGDANNLKA